MGHIPSHKAVKCLLRLLPMETVSGGGGLYSLSQVARAGVEAEVPAGVWLGGG